MSLKDRLQANNRQVVPTSKKEEEQPKYYQSNDAAQQLDSLGVLDALLIDDDINSIYVNGAKNIYINRKGKTHKSTTTYRDNVQLENIIKKNAQNIGIEIDEKNPYISFNHKEGINITATLPPLSSTGTIFIKCYKDKFATLQILQEEQSISKEITLILEALSSLSHNILIAGEKNTLKTTLLSSMAKKLPSNSRGVVIDFEQEFKINNQNIANYNFATLPDKESKENLLNLIIDTKPNRLYINTDDKNIVSQIVLKSQEGLSSLTATICAKSPNDAIEQIKHTILKQNPNMNSKDAQDISYRTFDIIIFVSMDEIGRRKISSISQIEKSHNGYEIKDIINFNNGEHKSTGLIPRFFEDIQLNSLPISANIFDITYKHTYNKKQTEDLLNQFNKKSANLDILKKFKKELPTSQAEEKQETPEINEQEALKKVQEIVEEISSEQEIHQEEITNEQQNENLY